MYPYAWRLALFDLRMESQSDGMLKRCLSHPPSQEGYQDTSGERVCRSHARASILAIRDAVLFAFYHDPHSDTRSVSTCCRVLCVIFDVQVQVSDCVMQFWLCICIHINKYIYIRVLRRMSFHWQHSVVEICEWNVDHTSLVKALSYHIVYYNVFRYSILYYDILYYSRGEDGLERNDMQCRPCSCFAHWLMN